MTICARAFAWRCSEIDQMLAIRQALIMTEHLIWAMPAKPVNQNTNPRPAAPGNNQEVV